MSSEVRLPLYLDNNATTPCDPRVVEAMTPFLFEHPGNPASSSHAFGWAAREAVEVARQQVAELINASSKEIVFTSGATESDNLAIKGVARYNAKKGKHIITVATEHKAILDSCHALEREGFEVTYLEVDAEGLISLDELRAAFRPDTTLVSIMFTGRRVLSGETKCLQKPVSSQTHTIYCPSELGTRVPQAHQNYRITQS